MQYMCIYNALKRFPFNIKLSVLKKRFTFTKIYIKIPCLNVNFHVNMGKLLFKCHIINKCNYNINYHDQLIKKYINLLRVLKSAIKKALGYYDLFNN